MRRFAALLAVAIILSGCGVTEARESAIALAKVKPLDMATNLRPGLVGLADYPATGWEPSALDFIDNTDAIDPMLLESIGLQQSDVGSALQIATIPDGDSLLGATMDFCDGRYPSEDLRVARLQRATYDQNGGFVGISTEVVVYANAAAAKQALAEVIKVRKSCPVGKEITARDGARLTHYFHSAPGPTATPLVDAESRLIVHTTMLVNDEPRRAFLVYQVYGRVLAALYVSEEGKIPFEQTSLDTFYDLAGDIADRLRAAPKSLLNGETVLNATQ